MPSDARAVAASSSPSLLVSLPPLIVSSPTPPRPGFPSISSPILHVPPNSPVSGPIKQQASYVSLGGIPGSPLEKKHHHTNSTSSNNTYSTSTSPACRRRQRSDSITTCHIPSPTSSTFPAFSSPANKENLSSTNHNSSSSKQPNNTTSSSPSGAESIFRL